MAFRRPSGVLWGALCVCVFPLLTFPFRGNVFVEEGGYGGRRIAGMSPEGPMWALGVAQRQKSLPWLLEAMS